MKKSGISIKTGALIVIFVFIMTSCATTNLTSVWKDDSYTGKADKIFIIGAAQQPGIRRIFEREFVNQLKSHGIYAVASNESIPGDKMLDKDVIVSKIRELDVNAVLVTRLLEKKHIVRQIPEYYSRWSRYYGESYESSCPRGYNCEDIAALETNLYDVKTEKLIWSAISETHVEAGTYKVIKEFIASIIKGIKEENILHKIERQGIQ